jgi:WD40 repeat protein
MSFMGANLPGKDGVAAPTHLWVTDSGVTDLSIPVIEDITAAAGSGHLVLVTKRGQSQPSLIDAATGKQSIVPVDLKSYGIDVNGLYIQMVWHPQLGQIAIFDPNNFLIVDLDSNHVDAFDLGYDNDEYHGVGLRWAFDARWSPDGQYLALITTQGTPILPYTELSILDLATHKVVNHDLGHRYVTDVAWSPDSKILLTASVIDNAEGKNHLGLFLVNSASGAYRRVLPDTPITGGQFSFGLNWSPNGEIVAIYCPTSDEGRVCTMNVRAPQR